MDKKGLRILTVYTAGLLTLGGCANADTQNYEKEEEIIGIYEAEEDECTFQISVEEDGFYDLQFTTANIGGYKENYVLIDGESVGSLKSEEDLFTEEAMLRNFLTAGSHEITVSEYWGYIALDKLTVLKSAELPEDYYQVTAKLSNENADDCARRLMSFLADNYGKNILSGQYCDKGLYGHEMACIWAETGKFPAVVGFDMIEYQGLIKTIWI